MYVHLKDYYCVFIIEETLAKKSLSLSTTEYAYCHITSYLQSLGKSHDALNYNKNLD